MYFGLFTNITCCRSAGGPIPELTLRVFFEYDEAGNQIYRGLCTTCKDSDSNNDVGNATLAEQIENKIQVAPVPVQTDLTVIWDLSIKNYITKIEMLPYNGFSILKSVNINSNSDNSYVFPMGSYPYGVYYLKFYLTDGSVYTRTIIKN
ncbi:MAG: hypothetical protein LBE36_05980 [Flavobacteriaceae bacterium]|nr:hypothetical protein [Flavobacteriaceae bacterium]